MFPRFDRRRRRLVVGLVASRRIGKTVRQERLGQLGAVVVGEPIGVSERIRFWVSVDRHLREIDAQHPGRVTPADVAKVKDAIARRIPRPRGEAELRLMLIATIQRDVMAAFDRLDNGEDAAAEAIKQLERLRRESRQNRQSGEQNGTGVVALAPNEERRP